MAPRAVPKIARSLCIIIILISAALAVLSGDARAQSVQCLQTPSSGTSNTTCANTAFVQSAVSAATSIPNGTMLANDSGATARASGLTPTSFWDSFCGNTIGYLWIRLTGGWACSPSFDAPVTWWGAACNGSTNDTAAINTAIASGIKNLGIPGTCNITTLNQLPVNLTLHGQNWISSCIQTTSATGDVLTLGSGDQIKDLCLTSTVTRTAGSMIRLGAGTLVTNVGNIALSHLFITNYFNGINLNGAQLIRATDIEIVGQSWSNDGVLIGAPLSTNILNTDIVFNGLLVQGGVNGIEITELGDATFIRTSTFAPSGQGILIDPNGTTANGNLVQLFICTACVIDSSGGTGLLENATNGAGIFTVKLVDSWVATNGLWGVGLETDTGHGSAITETDIVNSIIANNAFYGIVIQDNSNIGGTHISGNSIAQNGIGNSGGGIYIGVGANGFRIADNKIGFASQFSANNLSVNCGGSGSSPSEGMVIGNDMAVNNSGCAAWTFAVKANNINF